MHTHVAGLRERLAACITDMRLLPRMRHAVPSQVAGRREPRAANVTVEASRCAIANSFSRATAISGFGLAFRATTILSRLHFLAPCRPPNIEGHFEKGNAN